MVEKTVVLQELRRQERVAQYGGPRSPREHEQDRMHVVRRPGIPARQYPRWRNKYNQLVVDHQVTLEQELAEIRTRFEARREYNRQARILNKTRAREGAKEPCNDPYRPIVDKPDR